MAKTVSGAPPAPTNAGMVSPEADVLSLIITRPEDTSDCPFWIGVYKKGKAGAREVFNLGKIEDVFNLLNEQGLSETQALMLSDSSGEVVQQYYLVPETLCINQGQEAKSLIVNTVDALKPIKVGVYFGIDPKDPDSSQALLEEILLGLAGTGVKQLFLFTGNLGVNAVLNAALRVKQGMAESKEMTVFH